MAASKLTDAGLYESFAAAGMAPMDVMEKRLLHARSAPRVPQRSPASDLYALGVILYRHAGRARAVSMGRRLYPIAMRHRKDVPLRPSQFNPIARPTSKKSRCACSKKIRRLATLRRGSCCATWPVGPSPRTAHNDPHQTTLQCRHEYSDCATAFQR
jgi:hypothetical protein